MEIYPIEQLNQRLALGRGDAGAGRQLAQGGEPFQGIVRMCGTAKPLQLDAAMFMCALSPIVGMA